jgi:hypothetical protein
MDHLADYHSINASSQRLTGIPRTENGPNNDARRGSKTFYQTINEDFS